jgi:hypothetical protein
MGDNIKRDHKDIGCEDVDVIPVAHNRVEGRVIKKSEMNI